VLDERGGKLDIGEELDVGPVGKLPPREECSICMQVLPSNENLQAYAACCGKTLCCGCNFQHQMKSKKRATERQTCAFCREPMPRSDEEILVRLRKRADQMDRNALCNLAMKYGRGMNGVSVNRAKCIELLRQSAGLGYYPAQYNLGAFHKRGEMGLHQDDEEALKYFTEAAEGGDVESQYTLGCTAYENSDHVAAMRHWRLSASGGLRPSMNNLIVYFQDGLLRHGDLAETLQEMYRSRAEMKSEARDQYIKHLKETGKYDDSMDL
jgi:TPR repeat protein